MINIRVRLKDKFKKAQDRAKLYLTDGIVDDYASYRFHVGRIKGLEDAITICEEIFKGKDDDE